MQKPTFILLILLLSVSIARAQFAGGSGTEDDPYQVEDFRQLQEVRNNIDKHFIQTDAIDTGGSESRGTTEEDGFEPIGNEKAGFTGTYNGNGFQIYNLYIDRELADHLGLFGVVDEDGKIQNVILENVTINGRQYVGSLAGINHGTIINSYARGSVTGTDYTGGLTGQNRGTVRDVFTEGDVTGRDWTGGLIGQNVGEVYDSYSESFVTGRDYVGGLIGISYGVIYRSYAEGDVSGRVRIGGLAGSNAWRAGAFGHDSDDIIIQDSYADGNVTASSDRAGGLIGDNHGHVLNSHARGDVTSGNRTGGLIGQNSGMVENCHAKGKVSGSNRAGGLIGLNRGEITGSYAKGDVSGSDQVGGLVGPNYGIVQNSYSKGKVSGENRFGDLIGSNYGNVENSFARIKNPDN